jgi:hypothetical protein
MSAPTMTVTVALLYRNLEVRKLILALTKVVILRDDIERYHEEHSDDYGSDRVLSKLNALLKGLDLDD